MEEVTSKLRKAAGARHGGSTLSRRIRTITCSAAFVMINALAPAAYAQPLYDPNDPDNMEAEGGKPETRKMMEQIGRPEIEDAQKKAREGGEMEQEAKEWLSKSEGLISGGGGGSIDNHPYNGGTDTETIAVNHIYDAAVAVGDIENFKQCMDYQIIGACLGVVGNVLALTPYVSYYVPYQKVENVDQPFKTGYLDKETVTEGRRVMEEEITYYDDAPIIAESEINTTLGVLDDLKRRSGGKPDNLETDTEIIEKAVKDLQEGKDSNGAPLVDKEKRWRHTDPTAQHSGYVYNQYHVMPTFLDLWYPPAFDAAQQDTTFKVVQALFGSALCHKVKDQNRYLFSDWPTTYPLAKWSFLSAIGFSAMWERLLNPLGCAAFNMYKPPPEPKLGGREVGFEEVGIPHADAYKGTAPDMFSGLVSRGSEGSGDDCVTSIGPWLPLLDRTPTVFHTSAAAVGTVKGISGGWAFFPDNFYKFMFDNVGAYNGWDFQKAYDGDKVQWAASNKMDGPPVTDAPDSPKPCRPIERFVLKYGDANRKTTLNPNRDERKNMGHWHVTVHWKYVRCCILGAVPLYPAVPTVCDPVALSDPDC